ncbi:hypothetical protein LAUMK42_04785 [Mycobacterium persicum]|uniref:Uncharacterized protein n=1 Tax=Mycobacterium persicum TaxID=1487726 RepID=A0AB38UYP8_9MYCO|nr:hypothetical protein LAUMK42_04785 [Mycobacterium persicum]
MCRNPHLRKTSTPIPATTRRPPLHPHLRRAGFQVLSGSTSSRIPSTASWIRRWICSASWNPSRRCCSIPAEADGSWELVNYCDYSSVFGALAYGAETPLVCADRCYRTWVINPGWPSPHGRRPDTRALIKVPADLSSSQVGQCVLGFGRHVSCDRTTMHNNRFRCVVHAGISAWVSGHQHRVQHRIEQTQTVVGRTGQRLDRVFRVGHQPDHPTVGRADAGNVAQ